MKRKTIKTLRVLAVALLIGVTALYLIVPASQMPRGIGGLLHDVKRMGGEGGPPVFLSVFWIVLLIAEIPFSFKVKNDNNIFADEYGRNNAERRSTAQKKAPVKPGAVKKPPAKKPTVKPGTAKKPPVKKPVAAKQTGGERTRPQSQKAPDRKPTSVKQTGTQVTREVKAQTPAKASAAQSKAASRPMPASSAAAAKPVRPKTTAYSADLRKSVDEDSFDQFLNELKQDYLNN